MKHKRKIKPARSISPRALSQPHKQGFGFGAYADFAVGFGLALVLVHRSIDWV